MKALITTLACVAATLFATAGHATTHKEAPMGASCEAKATEKKLAGAAKTSFMKKCEADTAAMAPAGGAAACEAQAAEKKLAGAAKTSFVKKCSADTKTSSAAATCDAKAAEKKLAGAAKTSFTKKCLADAGA